MPKIEIILSDILQDRNMTQTELVKLTGIRSETISNLTRNKVERITLEHLAKIMTALKITDMNEILKYVNESDILVDSTAYPVIEHINEQVLEDESDPLDEVIEMLDLPPAIFYKIRRYNFKIKTIRELMEIDLTRIPRIGPTHLKTLNESLNKFIEKHR